MYKRLKALRKEIKLTQEEFAKSLGLGKSSIAMIETGERALLDRHIKLICTLWNVNEDWLVNGNGEMFDVPKFSDDIRVLANKYNLSDKETFILEKYLDMTEDKRKAFADMIFELASKSINFQESDNDTISDDVPRIIAARTSEI